MPEAAAPFRIKVAQRLSELSKESWDACAGGERNPDRGCNSLVQNPFLRWDFLEALEASGSVTANRGWQPLHLAAFSEDGVLQGAMPLYLKSHSQGEYVFDYAWADALHRAGGRYYPKLQCSVPFTPVTGERLLSRSGQYCEAVRASLVQAATELAAQVKASSLHITFPTETQWHQLGALGLLQRTDQQFHWHNRGYSHFDDFLSDLSSKKRKKHSPRTACSGESRHQHRLGPQAATLENPIGTSSIAATSILGRANGARPTSQGSSSAS